MSTPKPPKGSPTKTFLGEEDLASELDAWEGIFDALHEESSEVHRVVDEPPFDEDPQTLEIPMGARPSARELLTSEEIDARSAALGTTNDARSAALGTTNVARSAALGTTIDARSAALGTTNDARSAALGTTNDARSAALGTTIDARSAALGTTNDAALGTTIDARSAALGTTIDDAFTIDEPLPDLEDQMTLDRAVPASVDVEDPRETDFSDVAGEAEAAPLPSLPVAPARVLTPTRPPAPRPQKPTLQPLGDDDDNDNDDAFAENTRAIPPGLLEEALAMDEPSSTLAITPEQLERALSTEPVRGAPPQRAKSPADDDIYTSASRPISASGSPFESDDDALAEPPLPRRPSIVRRATVPPSELADPDERNEQVTPARGVDISVFAESTKVQDVDELEQQRGQSRSEKATLPPPVEDDDYELEIDAEPSIVPIVMESSHASRRTAHVLRRTEQPTRPPPFGAPTEHPARDSEPVIEMNLGEEPAAPRPPASEDDFSDVAAEVSAAEAAEAAAPAAGDSFDALDALDAFDDPSLAQAQTGFNQTLPSGPSSLRPPALTDLYPRVKTPTSVPPLGLRTLVGTDAFEARRRAGTPTAPLPPEPPDGDMLGKVDYGTDVKPDAKPEEQRVSRRLATPLPLPEPSIVELEPDLDVEAIGRDWPEQVAPLPSATLDEDFARALLVYEREVATLDDSAASAALRIEAGRLCERLADGERARMHYEAALLADPRATAALRGLRRIARATGDLDEVTRHLDTELGVAGALERRPLGHYRVDLLMASGEQDLARVAVGEILDSAPSDVRALLAHLELAFVDGRGDEFGAALEQLAHAVVDHELRAAVQSARGVLAAHHNDIAAAASWFRLASDADPGSLAARLGAIRHAVVQGNGEAAAAALMDLARRVEANDTTTAAAAALRAAMWHPDAGEGAKAARYAATVAPDDALVARLAAEQAASTGDPTAAGYAFAQWARSAGSPWERAYAAARAAELDPARGTELWSLALELDPGDDYAAAQLRTAHVALDEMQASIDVDLAVSVDRDRDRARLRAAYGLIAQGDLDAAIEVLERGRRDRPGSLALSEALGEALAAAGKWDERARLFAELAEEPGEQLDRDVAQLRSAIAWEEAVGSIAAQLEVASDEDGHALREVLESSIKSALEAWDRVLDHNPHAPTAHAASLLLASRMGDDGILLAALERAQTAERAPYAAASLALRRARIVSAKDPAGADALLRDLAPAEDPRRTLGQLVAGMRANDLGEVAAALEDRALLVEREAGRDRPEVAMLRLRAAQLALDGGDAVRATRLLHQVEAALPNLGIITDLLAAARRRAGERPGAGRTKDAPASTASSADAFARVIRDADLAAQQNDGATALALYQRALELRPNDPLASVPLMRLATQLREAAPATRLALAQLRHAEDAGDGIAKAVAYELLAHIDAELRSDSGSAQIALESASQSDPSRIDLMHRLERHYAVGDQLTELLRLRQAEVATIPDEHAKDRAALRFDLAGLATRDHRPELEIVDLYRGVLADDPASRLALLHLEASVRRAGFSEELADLEDKIAAYFEGDARSQAAFWTRAGETLAEVGKIDDAVQRFNRAEAAVPGHVPALEGWRQAALKGQLWVDVAEAAARQAANTADAQLRGALHHFAGVALMDKALVGEQAMASFHRALEAAPDHRDAFLRLRILLEEDANHDDLATLLIHRLDVERDPTARTELHRAIAELHRNFLSDRETAKLHYRAILDDDPNDLRAHAAIADIAWEQGNWQEAADALMARARLERQPDVLKTLCFRLGLIYSGHLSDNRMALKAFQRALTFAPDDENTLVKLADLATQEAEWKLALGACERLVKNEADPERRASHLHRVARIFKQGFGDHKRAERALNLALDTAPTNDESLQQLVQFYKEARDLTSVRVHLNRVTGTMRAKLAKDPKDGTYYRVISRAMAHRAAAGVPGSMPIARAAAELAGLLGGAGEPERQLLAEPARPDASLLAKPESDEVLFPRTVQVELRQLFHLLGDRIAKHVGIDLRAYGVTRGDRLRGRESAVASVAQSVASALGFENDVDVYVSQRQPWAMAAEPTSPVSLILGSAVVAAGGDAIRFAAGSALKLAQSSLAIPARLPLDELGVLTIALLRLFQPELPVLAVDPDAVATQTQKLKRLIPTSLHQELKPFALAVDPKLFSHRELARDLRVAGLRAGLVTSGSLVAGLRILAGQAAGSAEDNAPDLAGFLADPAAQGLVAFALSEDLAAVAR